MGKVRIGLLLMVIVGLLSCCTVSREPRVDRAENGGAPPAGMAEAPPMPAPAPAPAPAVPLQPVPRPEPEYAERPDRAPAAAENGYEPARPSETENGAPLAESEAGAEAGAGAGAGAGAVAGGMISGRGGLLGSGVAIGGGAAPAEAGPAAANGGGGPAAANGAAAGAPELSLEERWQEFLASFQEAAYTFNPPSPIKIAKPYTIHLWVDTTVGHQALAEELRHLVPRDASRVESGEITVSPVMKAVLTGENFTIKPNSPEQQRLNLAGRTIWSWEITPTWPGTQTLHLRLVSIPPEGIGDPYTIPVPLDRTIEVEVTVWWLFDHFFTKYWKWLLGGIGTLILTLLGWWWQKRSAQKE